MSVTSTQTSVTLNGNNSTVTPYTIPFVYQEPSDIVVSIGSVTLVNGTDYTLISTSSGVNLSGTFTTSVAQSGKVTISRVLPLTQNSSYTAGGAFPAATQEAALDRLTMMIQQIVGSAGITAPVIYPLITGLTGGGATNLDGIVTAGGVIPVNYVLQVFLNQSGSTFFRFEPTALTSSQLPGIVLPADWNASTNPNAWYQQ